MTTWVARGLPALLVLAGTACGADVTSDEPPTCSGGVVGDAMAPPAGVQRGEPYRWLGRSWRSPLGLTVQTYGLAVDGVPIFGPHQVEVYDRAGQLAYRAGSGDAVLAELRGRGAAAWAAWRHPLASRNVRGERMTPLAHTTQHAVWHHARGDLVAAVVTERLDLRGDGPVGER